MNGSVLISLLLTVLFLMSGCGGSGQDKHTKVFNYYPGEMQGREIPDEPFTYLLINRTKCKGCVDNQLAALKEVLENREDIMLFTSDPDVYRLLEGGKSKGNIFHDQSGLLDKVNLEIFNITILKTENGKVKSFRALMIDENEHFKDYL